MLKKLTPLQAISKLERIDNAIGFPWFTLALEIHDSDNGITIKTFDTMDELLDCVIGLKNYTWFEIEIQYEIGSDDLLMLRVKGVPEVSLTKGENNA